VKPREVKVVIVVAGLPLQKDAKDYEEKYRAGYRTRTTVPDICHEDNSRRSDYFPHPYICRAGEMIMIILYVVR
jgi:hypothetical protein